MERQKLKMVEEINKELESISDEEEEVKESE